MKHRPVPYKFIRGRYPPSLYLDFAEGFGYGQGALITGSAGTGGTAVTSDGILITDQSFSVALSAFDFNQSEGTFFIEAKPTASDASFKRALSFNDGTINEEYYVAEASGNVRAFVTDGGVTQATYNLGSWGLVTRKIAMSYSANNILTALGGVPGTPDTAATLPTPTTLGIGHVASSNRFTGYIRRIAYWPHQFGSGVLQNLTA